MSPVRINPPTTLSFAWHEEQLRAETEKKIENLRLANDVAKKLGYNFEGRKDTVVLLNRMIKQASEGLARECGDAYSPMDMDMYFPTAEWLAKVVHNVAKGADILKTTNQPELSLKI